MHILLKTIASNITYNIDYSSNMLTFVKKNEQNSRFNSERGWKESSSTEHSESSFILSQKESKNYQIACSAISISPQTTQFTSATQ